MLKFIANINTKEYVIENIDGKYLYNGNVLDNVLVDKFVSNIIKLCLANDRKKKNSVNNKIEIFYNDHTSVFKSVDLQVIKYLSDFLK